MSIKQTYQRASAAGLIILAFAIVQHAHAQDLDLSENPVVSKQGHRPIQFDRLSIQEGLMQRTASALFQDRNGFMWIGTQDGIDRYDGYTFDSFKYDPSDSTTVQPGFISDFIEDSAGDIWVASSRGLSRHDPLTDSFERFMVEEDIWEITETEPGVLWIASIDSGLIKLELPSGNLTYSEELFDGQFNSMGISSLETRTNGDLWIGTPYSGVFILEAGSDKLIQHKAGENGLGLGPVLSLFEDSNDVMWVGAWGLHSFNQESESFELYLPNSEKLLTDRNLYSNENLVTTILEDDNESLWVGMGFGHGTPEGGGIAEFDKTKKVFYRYRHDPTNSKTLRNDNIFSLEKDRNGNVWVGTATEGVSRFDAMDKSFSLYSKTPNSEIPYLRGGSARGVVVDRNGVLWIVMTDGFLNRIDRNSGTHEFYELGNGNLPFLFEEANGLIMACNPRGRCRLFDPEQGKVVKLIDNDDKHGGVYQGKSGQIYRGLDLYDPQSKDFLSSSGPEKFIQIQHEDLQGNMWFASRNNMIGRFDPKTGETEIIEDVLAGWAMTERAEEPGVLWITHIGTGLKRYDTRTRNMTRYSEQNSELVNNSLYGIFADEQGHLWMSSNDGIIKFEPETETFHSFGVGNGLQSQEFDAGSHYMSPKGEIFFGGANGVNSFFPDRVEVDPIVPQTVLTGVRLFNQEILPGPDSPLAVPISDAKKLVLPHDENDLTFEYVGIQFDRPEKNQYAYKLDNYDEDWRYVNSQRQATYTSLDPGDYTFRVKSSNADGIWNEEAVTIDLTISPPWWRTIWAYLLFGLTFVLGVFGVDRFQRARLIHAERARAELTEKELRATAAEASAELLKSENRRQTQELDSARELQLSMLPSIVPEIPQLRIKTYMKTAVEVGGDYYDFELNDENTLTCAIGDATGHGAKAGTMVTATKSLWSAYSEEKDLATILKKSHRALRKLGLPSLYMSLALARIEDDKLELVGAGLPDALLYRSGTGVVESIPIKGIPLGGPHDTSFSSISRKLEAGDTLLLMTDGFPELFNEAGEMLGYDTAVEKFARIAMGSVDEIVEKLEADCVAWSGSRPVDDDVTFLVLKYV